MRLDQAINLDDLRKLAKRRLPKVAFDFIEGGCDDEEGVQRNEDAFKWHRLVPRYMIDVTARTQKATLFGRTYDSPFGIAPTGIAALFRPGADMMLAGAAKAANIPVIMSGTATATIADLEKTAPEHGWFQMYTPRDMAVAEDLIRRAKDANLSTFAITVDVPMDSNRERNRRNGFSYPIKLPLRTKLEALLHPGWMAGYLKHGTPTFWNWQPYAEDGGSAAGVATYMRTQVHAPLTWDHVKRFRDLWPRNFVLKGIMHPEDAKIAAAIGVDGLMVSNHGGRQLDRAPSPLETLPAIRDAVGDRVTLMLDGGVRRGSDVLVALCLGAKFVFLGRSTLYGAAVAGAAGVSHAIGILQREIDVAMAQIGCPSLDRLGPDFLLPMPGTDPMRNARP